MTREANSLASQIYTSFPILALSLLGKIEQCLLPLFCIIIFKKNDNHLSGGQVKTVLIIFPNCYHFKKWW